MKIVAWDLECNSLSGMIGRLLASGFKEVLPDSKASEPYVFRGDARKYRMSGDISDDSKLAIAIRDELEKFDVLVTHNGKLFDRKFLNARLLKAGERPLESMFHIDTMWIIRSHLRASSKLDNIQKFLGLEDEKTPISWDAWQRASGFNKDAMDEVVDHVTQDVLVLEQAYWRLLPLMRTISRA